MLASPIIASALAAAAWPAWQTPVTDHTRQFLVRQAPAARAMLYGALDVPLCGLALRDEVAPYRQPESRAGGCRQLRRGAAATARSNASRTRRV